MAHHNRVLYRVVMRFVVWNMRWMTRYVGFIARPCIRWYGEHEVIACGLREESGEASLIYTPLPTHRAHRALVKEGKGPWRETVSEARENFSGSIVRRIALPEARVGSVYKMSGKTARGGTLSSPAIFIRQETIRDADLLDIRVFNDGEVLFSWPRSETFDPMIYFLALENDRHETLAAVYTREISFRYPRVTGASYSVGPSSPPALSPRERHKAKLALVDYDGWVSHLAERAFIQANG